MKTITFIVSLAWLLTVSASAQERAPEVVFETFPERVPRSDLNEPRTKIAETATFDVDSREARQGNCVPYDCNLDVVCYEVNSIAQDATGRMSYNNDGPKNCTGTLLADLDTETVVPYFITANHCISTQQQVNTMTIWWRYETVDCEAGGVGMDPVISTGGTLLETEPETGQNDMTLIRLSGPLPAGIGMAGWTTAHATGEVYGIHHPCGSWKRVTFFTPSTVFPPPICADATDYDYFDYEDGIIQGGSSGSGLFNSLGQFLGQLSGWCGPPGCDWTWSTTAYYGEFAETYPVIRKWLEIGGTINVNGSYSGEELGTPSEPFNTVTEGYDFAWDGSRVRIQAGSYPEILTFSKELTVLAAGGTVTIGN